MEEPQFTPSGTGSEPEGVVTGEEAAEITPERAPREEEKDPGGHTKFEALGEEEAGVGSFQGQWGTPGTSEEGGQGRVCTWRMEQKEARMGVVDGRDLVPGMGGSTLVP